MDLEQSSWLYDRYLSYRSSYSNRMKNPSQFLKPRLHIFNIAKMANKNLSKNTTFNRDFMLNWTIISKLGQLQRKYGNTNCFHQKTKTPASPSRRNLGGSWFSENEYDDVISAHTCVWHIHTCCHSHWFNAHNFDTLRQ